MTTMKLSLCLIILMFVTVNGDSMDELIERLLKDPRARELIANKKPSEDYPPKTKSEWGKFRAGDSIPPSNGHGQGFRGDSDKAKNKVIQHADIKATTGGDDSSDVPPRHSRFNGGGAFRGDAPPVSLRGGFRGDAKLLDQLKSLLEETIEYNTKKSKPETKEKSIVGLPWKRTEMASANGDILKRTESKESLPSGLPWKRTITKDGPPSGLPWIRTLKKDTSESSDLASKKDLYKRLVGDINELFRMTGTHNDVTKKAVTKDDKQSVDLSELLSSVQS